MTRVAVIDIGTNSTRLLVAEVDPTGRVDPLCTDLSTTRLGQGIEGGVLLPGAVDRTVRAIESMLALARERSASITLAAATSAVRDAANRDWFLEEVWGRTGLRVQVLEGRQEAFLSCQGVLAGFGREMAGSVIVDIGGGSTEFTWEREGRTICRSVNAGAVRMTEGGYGRREIAEVLRETVSEIKGYATGQLIGVGGTVTTLAAMDLGLEVYDRDRVHGHALGLDRVIRLHDGLVRAGPEGRRRLTGLQPARADIIVAGVTILLEVMAGLQAGRILVSEADLMYGLALQAVKLSKQKQE